jgi:hypothetical protein
MTRNLDNICWVNLTNDRRVYIVVDVNAGRDGGYGTVPVKLKIIPLAFAAKLGHQTISTDIALRYSPPIVTLRPAGR